MHTHTTHVDAERLRDLLHAAMTSGISLGQLARDRTLVDALRQPDPDRPRPTPPGVHSVHARALTARDLITDAIAALPSPADEAMAIMFGLLEPRYGERLEKRRERAARRLHLQPATFHRNHEAPLLWEVTMQVYRRLADPAAATEGTTQGTTQ